MSIKFNITYECDTCDNKVKQKVNVTNRFNKPILSHYKLVKAVDLPKGWGISGDDIGSTLLCPECIARQKRTAELLNLNNGRTEDI